MKILLCSVPYRPSVGGIETVSEVLAEQFVRRGHMVTIVTLTPGADSPIGAPWSVVRRPRGERLWALCRDADVVLHNQISLRMAWPTIAQRRPWVIAHHTWTPTTGTGRVKHRLFALAENVVVSHALGASLDAPSTVLPNPYRASLFRPMAGVARDRDVVFVGRLVRDKGVSVLLQALQRQHQRGTPLTATIVGLGPEEASLRDECARRGLDAQVRFVGVQQGETLVRTLHEHRYLVVPSVWEEPFGLVALEGLACGCVPVVARSGGLPDAGGPCAVVFDKGSAEALAESLLTLHRHPAVAPRLLAHAPRHLARHRPERVAESYLRILFDACRRHRPTLAA